MSLGERGFHRILANKARFAKRNGRRCFSSFTRIKVYHAKRKEKTQMRNKLNLCDGPAMSIFDLPLESSPKRLMHLHQRAKRTARKKGTIVLE